MSQSTRMRVVSEFERRLCHAKINIAEAEKFAENGQWSEAYWMLDSAKADCDLCQRGAEVLSRLNTEASHE